MPDTDYHVHLISDSTGETLHMIAKAALAPFPTIEPNLHISVFVRTADDVEAALTKVRKNPGLIVYTLADADLQRVGRNLKRGRVAQCTNFVEM